MSIKAMPELREIPLESDGIRLRPRQRLELAAILAFMRAFLAEFGKPASILEISHHLFALDAVSYSTATVYARLGELCDLGLVTKTGGRGDPRCYRPTPEGSELVSRHKRELRLIEEFMSAYQSEHQRPASIVEICNHMREHPFARHSRTTVHERLTELVEAGRVERLDGPRVYHLIDDTKKAEPA